jgi:hypothetical protein
MQVQFVRSGRKRRLLTPARRHARNRVGPHTWAAYGFHKRIEHAGT